MVGDRRAPIAADAITCGCRYRRGQNHLEEFLGLSVKIATDADPTSGAVTIRYTTLDQLDLICQRLTGGGF